MMVELAGRAYFVLCRALGWLLRSGKYSKARIVYQNGVPHVRKYRLFYAPVLVWMVRPLAKLLDTSVRVLPQREWEDRERRIHQSLRGASFQIDAGGVLVLPLLAGKTLATLLEDPNLEESLRKRAVEQAVVALAEFHNLGFTHGDAMAENVMISGAGVAHWFDFETIHDSSRPPVWRRADDVRALLVTCLVRTAPGKFADTLELILDVYGDEAVTHLLAKTFSSVFRRPLAFHLAQAGLSFQSLQEISRLVAGRRERAQRGG